MHQPTVALIEDDPDFNELLGLYIKNDPDLNLIATGRNGQEAITIANTLRPEVLSWTSTCPSWTA